MLVVPNKDDQRRRRCGEMDFHRVSRKKDATNKRKKHGLGLSKRRRYIFSAICYGRLFEMHER